MSDDDFSRYPKSLTEAKSNKTERASDWTPRDAIIAMLRRIDSGELVELEVGFVCVRAKTEDGAGRTHYFNASPNIHITMGTIETVKLKIWDDAHQ